MRILELKLENFMGIRSETFVFDGHNAVVFGNNGTGKTTIGNAIGWLFFDKPISGVKNFSPKTTSPDSPDGYMHYLEHSAEIRLRLNDGRIMTLKKLFKEDYKKRRGSAQAKFAGHVNQYFIDDGIVGESVYAATLMALCGSVEKMKMLTMPNFFAEDLSWDKRRSLLLDIWGDISDEEVIAGSPELKELPGFLLMSGTTDQMYTIDKYRTIANARKAKINELLVEIPSRIDEAKRAMPDIIGLDAKSINAKITGLNKKRAKLELDKAAALSGNTAASSVRAEISNLHVKMADARAKHINGNIQMNQSAEKAIQALRTQVFEQNSVLQGIENDINNTSTSIERMEHRRANLIAEYQKAQDEVWDESKEICPTCHQAFPPDDVDALREDFNLRRGARLEEINAKGQRECSKEMIEAEKLKLANLNKKLSTVEKKRDGLQAELEDQRAKLIFPLSFEQTEEYTVINAEINSARDKETQVDQHANSIVEGIASQIKAIGEQVDAEKAKKKTLETAATQQKRIDELTAEEKRISGEYEELEKSLFICDEFVRIKVSRLDDKINSRFKTVKFRLFKEQINGGLAEDCEVMVPNTSGSLDPFNIANNAARINAGLEIINTLSQHWGITMPIFVDNSEGVQSLIDMDAQVIQTVVPLAWEKMDGDVKGALIAKYGSEAAARATYTSRYDTLQMEVSA